MIYAAKGRKCDFVNVGVELGETTELSMTIQGLEDINKEQ